MPVTDPIQGWSTPAGAELPDGAAALASLANQAVLQVNMRFATAAARDAAIATVDRKAGMRAWVDALSEWTMVLADGGAWVLDPRDVFRGTEIAVVGASPPAGTLKIRHEYSHVGIGTGGGVVIPFPFPFPNGIVRLGITPGDNAAGLTHIVTAVGGCTLAGWFGDPKNSAGAILAVGAAFRAELDVVGW